MEPKPIPQKLINQGVGTPMKFGPPPEMEGEIGSIEILNIAHPDQIRAILTGEDAPFPPGSKDFWVCWWQPTDEERKRIAKGVPVRLTILGATQINPMNIDVGYDLEDHYHEQRQN